jgi:P27 family predicted phage terminase small subunit
MRGRKPTPSRLHELRGDPGKRHRSRDGEPRPNVLEKVGPVPGHLNDLAKAEYRRIMKEQVGLRMITPSDRASMAGYCSAYATYVESDERLKTEPWTTTTARGGSRPNPLFKIRDDALKLMNKFASEFGLTPSARARVKGAGAPNQSNLFDFLDADDDDQAPGKSQGDPTAAARLN